MNKYIIFSVLTLVLSSCTNYKDEPKTPFPNYQTVTVETINTNLKVINLLVDQTEFDEMYASYTEDIKIDGILDMYKDNVLIIEDKEVRIDIKGTGSAGYDLKSLGIKFDSKYKNEDNDYNLINPELLPNHSVDKIKAFRLRNSGNDFEDTMIKGISYTKLAINAGLDLDVMYGEQVVVFINNTFLGLMNFRTEKNANGLSKLYEVDKDDLTIAKIIEPGVVVKKDGDFAKIDAFISAIEQEDYDYLISEIDVSNFTDYMIFESYIANYDWPNNNVVFFAIEDGPFRFILFDLDHCNRVNLNESPFNFIDNGFENPITDLFNVLYANEDFKTQYDNRWNALMDSNLLTTAKFNVIVDTYYENIENLMQMHIAKYKNPETAANWHINVDKLKLNFEERENYIKN